MVVRNGMRRVFGKEECTRANWHRGLKACGTVLALAILLELGSLAWRSIRPWLTNDPLAGLPLVTLWLWERPEDLRFAQPGEVGFAVLAKTIVIAKEGLVVRPRLQPARLPAESKVLAVVRIETRPGGLSGPAGELRQEIVKEIAELAERPALTGIQIDFDAAASERPFYRELLFDLKRALPARMKLSITALASWCIYDDWISNLPVDEAVPMLFRMGAAREDVTHYLESGNDFRVRACCNSVGVALDELPANLPPGRRVYVFPTASWTEKSVDRTLRLVEERQ